MSIGPMVDYWLANCTSTDPDYDNFEDYVDSLYTDEDLKDVKLGAERDFEKRQEQSNNKKTTIIKWHVN